jgi:Domain of unknown function (DUF1127)
MESAMTNVVVHFPGTASHYGQLAHGTRRALDGLPDAVLKDIGLTRSEIPFVAGELVSRHSNPSRNGIDRFDWNAVWRNATILRLPETVLRLSLVAAATVSAVFVLSFSILT